MVGGEGKARFSIKFTGDVLECGIIYDRDSCHPDGKSLWSGSALGFTRLWAEYIPQSHNCTIIIYCYGKIKFLYYLHVMISYSKANYFNRTKFDTVKVKNKKSIRVSSLWNR